MVGRNGNFFFGFGLLNDEPAGARVSPGLDACAFRLVVKLDYPPMNPWHKGLLTFTTWWESFIESAAAILWGQPAEGHARISIFPGREPR